MIINTTALKKKYKLLAASLLCTLCITGCNKATDEEIALASFASSIENFTNYMKDADQKINSLDVSQRESVDELLSILDGMNEETAKLQTIDVPAQYAGIKQPVEIAVSSMDNAVSFYHSAYESDNFNADDADIAYQHYQKSMKCIKIIGYIIAGDEIPEDEHVTVYEEENDSLLIDKWLSDDDDDNTENETASETVPETVQ